MLSNRAKILKSLFIKGKVTVEGLRKAVDDGVITMDEFYIIQGIMPNEE